MSWLSSLFGPATGPTRGPGTARPETAREFQLENQARKVLLDHLQSSGIPYTDQLNKTVLSLIRRSDIADPLNRSQIISRCAYFYNETEAMKAKGNAIESKRREIASVKRLRKELLALITDETRELPR